MEHRALLPRPPVPRRRDEQRETQYGRLIVAMADQVAEAGFAETTVAKVARRAGVSTRAFYAHFADKEACLLAVYDEMVSSARANMAAGDAQGVPWRDGLAGRLRRWFDLLAAEPSFTRIYALEIWGAGPAARARAMAGTVALVSVLRRANEEARREDPSVLRTSETDLQVLAGGMHRLAVLHVIEDRIAQLPAVVDDVVALATAAVARRPDG